MAKNDTTKKPYACDADKKYEDMNKEKFDQFKKPEKPESKENGSDSNRTDADGD